MFAVRKPDYNLNRCQNKGELIGTNALPLRETRKPVLRGGFDLAEPSSSTLIKTRLVWDLLEAPSDLRGE